MTLIDENFNALFFNFHQVFLVNADNESSFEPKCFKVRILV